MVAPFGFGVGDIVQGITLIVDGVKALDDTKGAKKIYREFVECLTSLLDNFAALDNLDLPKELEQSKRRIRSRIARIRRVISEFVAATKKYQRHLTEPGLGWTDGIRKIQWRLCKEQDLVVFHERLRRQEQDLLTCLAQVNIEQNNLIFRCLTNTRESPILQNSERLLQELKMTQSKLAERSHAHAIQVRDDTGDVQGIPSEIKRVYASMLPSLHTPHLGPQDIQRVFGVMHMQTMAMLQEILSGVQQTGVHRASSQDSAGQTTHSEETSHDDFFEEEKHVTFENSLDSPLEYYTGKEERYKAYSEVTTRADDVDVTQYVIWKTYVTIAGIGHFSVILFRTSRSRSKGVLFHARAELAPLPWLGSTGLRVDVRFGRDPWRHITLAPELATFAVVPNSSDQFTYAQKGGCELLRRMIADRKASPRDRNEEGDSLLHVAIRFGRWDTCLMLLQEGTDIHASGSSGTICDLFFFSALNYIWNRIRPSTSTEPPGILSKQISKIFVKNYAHYSIQTETPAPYWVVVLSHPYAWHSFKLNAEKTYNHGGSRYSRNGSGRRQGDIITSLTASFRAVTDFEIVDLHGVTCVTVLAMFATHIEWPGYFDLLASMLKGGLNANSRTLAKYNAFHAALYGCIRSRCTEGCVKKINDITIRLGEVVRVLLKFGCDIFAKDESGRTPTGLANYLSITTKLDMNSVWNNALRGAGADVQQIMNIECGDSDTASSSSSGVDNTPGESTGIRRRRLPSIQNTSVDYRLCNCMWCCTDASFECMGSQWFKMHKVPHRPVPYIFLTAQGTFLNNK